MTLNKPPIKPAVSTASTPAANKPQVNTTLAAASSALPFKISKPNIESHYLKMLIYGDYGVGKTYLCGTSADVVNMQDVLLLSAERGELTLDAPEHNFENIDVIQFNEFVTVARIYDYLRVHCSLRDKGDEESLNKLRVKEAELRGVSVEEIVKPKMYRTVIVDSLSEVEAYCMYQLLGVSDKTGLAEEAQGAEWSEYKKQHAMVQRLIRAYRDLPMHVLMTCGRAYVQDDSKKMLFSPAMTGKLASQVQGFMDVVGYLATGAADDSGKISRRLYVQPVGRFSAKCRFSNFKGAAFDDPTMKKILSSVGLVKG